MLRYLSIVVFLFSGTVASANVNALFSADNSKLNFIIQGVQGDKDAAILFELMTAQAIDKGSMLEKTASYTNPAGQKSFLIGCRISKNIPDYGSCTITINKDYFTHVEDSAERRYVAYSVADSTEAQKISALFHFPEHSAIFFRSTDNKLDLSYAFSPDPINFALVFVEHK